MSSAQTSRGFSLFGVMMALIVGVIVVGVVMRYTMQAHEAATAQADARNVVALRQAIREAYPGGDYTGLTRQVLIDARLIPDTIRASGDSFRGATGALFVVQSGGVGLMLVSVQSEITPKQCLEIINGAQGSFDIIRAGTSQAIYVKDERNNVPFSPAQAITACGEYPRIDFYSY